MRTRTTGGPPDDSTYVLTGAFTGGGTSYVYTVSRRCDTKTVPCDRRVITSALDSRLPFVAPTVAGVATGSQWILAEGWSFSDTLSPGEGRLYRIRDATLDELALLGRSVSPGATAPNNQRKLFRESGGTLHEVFESGGEVFYRKTTNNGRSWQNTARLSDSLGQNGSPGITARLNTQEGTTYLYIIYSYTDNGGTGWSSPQLPRSSFSCPSPGPLQQ